MLVAREGFVLALPLAGVSVAAWVLSPLAGALGLLAALGVLAFFRDPPRVIPSDPRSVVSPADGVVVAVEETQEPLFIGQKARRISIFLSLFDVHINRSPLGGNVTYVSYVPGGHKSALRHDASKLNERNYLGIEQDGTRVLVCQIAGLLARRIVCRVNRGDHVQKGQRIGLIKFGSRVEIYLPLDMEVVVSRGTRVRGGESIMAYKT